MNVDLRELMRERSSVAEVTNGEDRVVQVHRRIARARRRRMAGAALGVFAVVGALAVAASLPPGGPQPAPQPAVTGNPIGDFPEYAYGARLQASVVGELPDNEVSVTVVPDPAGLIFVPRCSTPLWIDIAVEGRTVSRFTCHSSDAGWHGFENVPSLLDLLGLEPGSPVTFTVTATHGVGSGVPEVPLPETGSFALAVMRRGVPFEEYPLPPRPDTLPALEGTYGRPVILELTPDPADPQRVVSGTFAWSPSYELVVASQTPGFLHVSIAGSPVMTHERWDYQQGSQPLPLNDAVLPGIPEGTMVTITAEPEYMTGAWAVWIVRGVTSDRP